MRALVLVLLIGCSGGGDKITSVGETKKLNELSGGEMKQLCEDLKVFKNKKQVSDDDSVKIGCNAQAVMLVGRSEAKDDAALRAECKKALETCLAKKEKVPEAKEIDCNDTKFSGEMSGCEATVGQLTDCVNDMNSVLKKFANDDPCATLKVGDKDSISKFFDRMKSPKCDAIESKCKKGGAKASEPAKPAAGGSGSGSSGDDAAFAAAALTKLEAFRTQMCACKDTGCAAAVHDSTTKWGTEMAKTVDRKPSVEMAQKMSDVMTAYMECMTKVAGDRAITPK